MTFRVVVAPGNPVAAGEQSQHKSCPYKDNSNLCTLLGHLLAKEQDEQEGQRHERRDNPDMREEPHTVQPFNSSSSSISTERRFR
ncbi:unannotated protein [freshwater metagenome]|uniref:Unannotated protein n=1 Tax=freshwater metagenome TaxID=449393 RepID=A0A6J6SYK9_9ZZZZ